MRFVAVQLLQQVRPQPFAQGLRLDCGGEFSLLHHAIADRFQRFADEFGQPFGGGQVFLFLDMLIPTLTDPTMAPAGKHVATAFVQYAPHKLAPEHGGWDNIKEQFGDLVVDTISEFAPDFRDKIVGRQVMTPLDLERTIGLTEGNIFQGEILVQQMAFNRPVSGWARYKTPIRDYWLASSSAHPGGGIMAAPGRLAALEILKSKAQVGE